MRKELNEKVENALRYFDGFTNFIEVEDFRSFLLFTLTAQVPSNILAQMGLGGSKEVINIPYDPLGKCFYQKINLISGSLIVYVKKDPISEEFIIEKEDKVFHEYLNQNERDLAFRGKEKFIIPKVSECTTIDTTSSKLTVKVEDIFHDFKSFMAITEPNVLCVIDGKQNEPDLIFAFNMMPEIAGMANKKVLKVDIYLDSEHKAKGNTYLKKEEDFELEFMKDLKEISHAELYKSTFSLILHIKSFNLP